MKKIAAADVRDFKLPPYHFNMASAMLQSEADTGLKSFWVGLSHYLPEGGMEFSGADSPQEKVYLVLEGELTVKGEQEEFVLGPLDSLYIGPNEGKSIVNNTNKPATMVVIVST